MSKSKNGSTKAYAKEYRANNKEKIKAGMKKYYAENKEKIKAQRTLYVKNNKESIRKAKRASYLKRKEEMLKEDPLKLMFLRLQTRPYKNKKSLDITYEFIKTLWEKQEGKCYYSGIQMDYSYGNKNPLQVSVDRKDSTIPYTEENCVLCCLSINYAKNNFTEAQLRDFLKLLK